MFYKIYEIIYSEILLHKITSPLDVDERTSDDDRCFLFSLVKICSSLYIWIKKVFDGALPADLSNCFSIHMICVGHVYKNLIIGLTPFRSGRAECVPQSSSTDLFSCEKWCDTCLCFSFLNVGFGQFPHHVLDTDFITPNTNFNSASPGTTIKRRVWAMSFRCDEVRFGFHLFSWRGATVVSSSEVGMVTSYLLKTEGTSIFWTSKWRMNIQTLSPGFDVIHQCICLIGL